MKVFTDEFVTAVKAKLDTLKPLEYLTREQLCLALNISSEYIPALTMVTKGEQFAEFESVKSRGYRRKKIETT